MLWPAAVANLPMVTFGCLVPVSAEPNNSPLERPDRAGWVLVGGRSRRMGTDKALVDVGGQPLAARVASQIAPVCGRVSLVGDPARYAHLGFPVVPDRFAGEGPLSGIEAALRTTHSDWNLIVACDMPQLAAALLETLFSVGGDCSVAAYADGRVEPLCAVYHRGCHAVILAAIEAGVRSVKAVLPGLALRYVRVDAPRSIPNLNTPEDVARYQNG
jgi:molybdopterin-guanine dinucleotide biosynthesis protein A